MPTRRHVLRSAAAVLSGGPAWSQSTGLNLLEQFLQQVRSARAQFSQAVTSTPKNGQAARVRHSSGQLEFQRPGRFRFVYKKPFEQTLVADGQTLWLYDPDLQQVTARPQSQALAATPLALITSATQLSMLQADFVLQAEPAHDGLQWVRAIPRRADAQIRQALVGLRSAGTAVELVVLEVLDAFEQRSVLTFSGFEINPALRQDTFVFHPPAGVDVIRP